MSEKLGTVQNIRKALNGSTAKLISIALIAVLGGGLGVDAANDWRLEMVERVKGLEDARETDAVIIKDLKTWRDNWIKSGALPMDDDQNEAILELQAHAEVGTRFTGEDALVTAPCIITSAKAVRRIMLDRRSGSQEHHQDILESLNRCIAVVEDQLVQLRRRRVGVP